MSFKMGEAEANVITQALEEAKKLIDGSNPVLALEMICQDWMEEKGTVPERTSMEDHISYLERVYGVKVTYKAVSPAQKKKEKAAAKKIEAEAAKRAAEKVLKGEGEGDKGGAGKGKGKAADIEDLLDGDDTGGDDEAADINDLMGLDG